MSNEVLIASADAPMTLKTAPINTDMSFTKRELHSSVHTETPNVGIALSQREIRRRRCSTTYLKILMKKMRLVTMLDGNAASLEHLIEQKCAPLPSYVINAQLACSSYFGAHNETAQLQFFATGQAKWTKQLAMMHIEQEPDAKELFIKIHGESHDKLMRSKLIDAAQSLGLSIPAITTQMLNSTWQHFLDGTYGVCTKDGSPGTIAKKQLLVTLLDSFIAKNPIASLNHDSSKSLGELVNALDDVEPAFAPHERQRSSRQRCINDVRARFLS